MSRGKFFSRCILLEVQDLGNGKLGISGFLLQAHHNSCVTLDRSLGLSEPRLLFCEVDREGKGEFVVGNCCAEPHSCFSLFLPEKLRPQREEASKPSIELFHGFLVVLNTTPSSNYPNLGFGNHRPRVLRLQPEHSMLGRNGRGRPVVGVGE